MSTEITTTNADNTIALLRKGVQVSRQVLPEREAFSFMKFAKDGIWSFGQEDIECEEGSLWAVNPMSVKLGFVCWTKVPEGSTEPRKKLGHVLAPFYEDPVRVEDLPQHPFPWTEAASINLKCMSGEDEGTEVVWQTNSHGGLQLVRSLIDSFGSRLDDSGQTDIVPVGLLTYSTYNHKVHSKIYVPVFNIQKWVSLDPPKTDEKKITKKAVGESPFKDDQPEPEVVEKEEAAPASRTRTRRRRTS